MPKIKESLEILLKKIHHHNYLYHVLDKPEITDEAFDELIKERDGILTLRPDLIFLVNNKTPIDINIERSTTLGKIKHNRPMLSLKNVFSVDEVKEFTDGFPITTDYVYEHKLDGLALELSYLNGKPARLLTRGDGIYGEDVTHQLGLFKGIPDIPKMGEVVVRGEGLLTIQQFEMIKVITGRKFATARNAIAGVVRRKVLESDLNNVATFVPYELIIAGEKLSYSEKIKQLVEWGFIRPEKASYENIVQNLKSAVYPTDGIVIKVDSYEEALKAGETNHHPKWAVAYKFPADDATTKLINVIWQTGRLGDITPVAIYNPVVLGGVINDRCTLHNYKKFKRFNLRIDSVIRIKRAADVIPHLEEVISHGKGRILRTPKVCPSCGEPVVYEGSNNEDVFLRCVNALGCPAQRTLRFVNFVDVDALNIVGLGLVTIGELVDGGHINEYKDIFHLKEHRSEIPTTILGVNMFNKVVDAIEKSRVVEAHSFIKGLGLPEVGVGISKVIAKSATTGTELIELLKDSDRLKELDDIGWATAFGIVNALKANNGLLLREIERVIPELTLLFIDTKPTKGQIAISGKFDIPRKEIIKLANQYGYELTNSVSKKSKFLLCGHDASQTKIDKANQNNISVIVGQSFDESKIKEVFDSYL